MDVANRSELVLEDRGVTKGEASNHKRYVSSHALIAEVLLLDAGVEASACYACAQMRVCSNHAVIDTALCPWQRGETRFQTFAAQTT